MRVFLIAAMLIALASHAAVAQMCPEQTSDGPMKESAARALTGKVVYHDEIRQWIGLQQLDAPVCGETEIQLVDGDGGFEVDELNVHSVEVFRGCRVTVRGPIGIPGTGYYSAELYQNVEGIEPAAGCVRQPAFPDYSKSKPPASIRSYRVSIQLDYRPHGNIRVSVRDHGHTLSPWQTYASYSLTGEFALYADCADGFTVRGFRGTPEAKPWRLDNQILMDPESAAAKGIRIVALDFGCHR